MSRDRGLDMLTRCTFRGRGYSIYNPLAQFIEFSATLGDNIGRPGDMGGQPAVEICDLPQDALVFCVNCTVGIGRVSSPA